MSAFNCHITGISFYCKFEEEKKPLTSSIAIIDAAVIVVRGCLLQLIVCRGFYFVEGGGGSFYPIANEVAKGYTCSNATFRSSVCPPVTSLYFDKKKLFDPILKC